jgi:hypothetical protein
MSPFATADIVGTMFRTVNDAIEQGVNTGNFGAFGSSFDYLNKISETSFKRYINEGSYYPALSFAMRRGDFQKVFNALKALNELGGHIKIETSQIRICRAACMLQLKMFTELSAYIENRQDPTSIDLLRQMISSSQFHEKKAYEELLNFFQSPPDESP